MILFFDMQNSLQPATFTRGMHLLIVSLGFDHDLTLKHLHLHPLGFPVFGGGGGVDGLDGVGVGLDGGVGLGAGLDGAAGLDEFDGFDGAVGFPL